MQRSRFSVADLALVMAVTIWGANFSITKIALSQIAEFAFTGVRFWAATLVMLLLCRWLDGGLAVARDDQRRLVLLGLVGHTAFQALFIVGLNITTASHAAIIMASGPVFTMLMAWAMGYERIQKGTVLGVVMSMGGVVLVMAGESDSAAASATLTGDLLILLTSVCWAFYTVYAIPLMKRYSALRTTTISMAYGSLPLVPLCLPEAARQPWAEVNLIGWGAFAFSTLLALCLAYVAWYFALARLGGSRTAIYQNLTPVIGVLAARGLLRESWSLKLWLGCALVVAGVVLTKLDRGAAGPQS